MGVGEDAWVGGGVQERLSEIVTPRYLAERTDSKTVPWSMYLVWMGHLTLVICRTWHLDGLKFMPHLFPHISRMWRSFCRVIDSPSQLIARYMTVSSAKSLTLDLTWSGRSFIYARKSMGPRTEPSGTPEDTAIMSDLTPFKTTAWEWESKTSCMCSLLTRSCQKLNPAFKFLMLVDIILYKLAQFWGNL